jgi:effector-binding domain-containing protein
MDNDTNPQPEIVTVDPATTAVVSGTFKMIDIRDVFDRSFSALGTTLATQGIAPMGPAFGLYHGEVGETVDLELGFVTDRPVQTDGDVHAGQLPGGPVARLVHVGGFGGLSGSWARLRTWVVDQGLVPGADIWEAYLVEPTPDMDPADLRTELNWLLDEG